MDDNTGTSEVDEQNMEEGWVENRPKNPLITPFTRITDHLDTVLKRGQKFIVIDLRKERGRFSVFSEEQLRRMYEDGRITDEHFCVKIAYSADMGYSYSQFGGKEEKKRFDDEQG